jgi:high-affinity nickel-transport protein
VVHRHRHVVEMPADPFFRCSRPLGAFGVGMLHGVGAETPTQVLVFTAAAGADGTAVGLTVLVAFVVGLLISNTLLAFAATCGFLGAQRNTGVHLGISIVTAVFSLALGALLLAGHGAGLPEIFHG